MQYWPIVNLIFVCLEVLLYGQNPAAQAIVSLGEYAFVFIVATRNRRLGIMYLVSFSLLAFGEWTYVTDQSLPSNFWGLRIAGVSLNIAFTALVAIWCFAGSRFRIARNAFGPTFRFLRSFIVYAAVLGTISVLLGLNYAGNFVRDAAVYASFFLYAYLLSMLSLRDATQIVRTGVALTVFSMLISLFLHRTFQYGEGQNFVPMNAFAYLILYAVFFVRSLYSPRVRAMLFAGLAVLLVSGSMFLGGKALVVTLGAVVWTALRGRRGAIAMGVLALLLVAFMAPLLALVADRLGAGALVLYKFNQIYSVFQVVDLDTLSSSATSVGNILAEGRTIAAYLVQHPFTLLVGKGFGGGTPDVLGLLTPFTGAGAGYADQDAIRNDFVRMHLPVFEVFLKAGLLGVGAYLSTLVGVLKRQNMFSFLAFVLFATVFTNSKEMMLLSLLLAMVAEGWPAAETSRTLSDSARRPLVTDRDAVQDAGPFAVRPA